MYPELPDVLVVEKSQNALLHASCVPGGFRAHCDIYDEIIMLSDKISGHPKRLGGR